MILIFLIFVCGSWAHTSNRKLPTWCTRTCPYDQPFHAGFSQVSVSGVLEKNLTGGCQTLKALWKIVHIGIGLLQHQREVFERRRYFHPIHLHWSGDLAQWCLLRSREGHCRQTQTLSADITSPRALKWSRKPLTFRTHVGRTGWLSNIHWEEGKAVTDFMVCSVWMGITKRQKELSVQLSPLHLHALSYLIYPFRHISVL